MAPEWGTMGKLTHLFSHNCTIPKCPSPFSKLIKSSAALTFLIYRRRAGSADRSVDQNMKIRLNPTIKAADVQMPSIKGLEAVERLGRSAAVDMEPRVGRSCCDASDNREVQA